jgi:hypothetical protein
MRAILSVLAVIFVIGAIAGPSDNKSSDNKKTSTASARRVSDQADRFMEDINAKVVRDAEREYQIASSSGSSVDRCVQAGLVAAAHLQAHNQPSYQSWKMREAADCKY